MLGRLFLIMTFVPLIELWLLFRLGGQIGALNTLAVVLFTGFLGAYFLKQQGHSILREAQEKMGQKQVPADAMLKGLLTFIGGVLLLTPGFLTDVIGFSLVLPFTQIFWRAFLGQRIKRGIANGNIHVGGMDQPFGNNPFGGKSQDQETTNSRPTGDVIDISAKSSSKKT